jgi:tetratricopeptide (TPR) repeat protein
LVAGAVVLTYWPVLRAGLVWDDDAHITRPELRSARGLWQIWFEPGATQQYYPFLHSAFWVEHRMWADAPLGYHLANVLLHAVAAWLLFLLLRRLSVAGARLAALGFALHPVCVESVAWISEQKNTLSAVFCFSAALAYFRFDRDRRAAWYALASALFVLALASKTVTATLPAAILVVLWWRNGRISKKDLLPLAPWLVLGAAAGWVTAHVEKAYIGARGTAFDLSAMDRLLVAGRAVWFYLGKVFWPVDLAFIYPHWDVDARVPWQYLFPSLAALVLAALYAIRRRWRGPLASALIFVGTLFPALGFFNVYPFIYSYVADHFQYIAAAVAIASAVGAQASIPVSPVIRKSCLFAAVGIVFVLAGLTRRQCLQYADAETLWRATLAKNPDCGMARGNLGAILMGSGRVDEAIAQYRAALETPHYRDAAEAHYNLGCGYQAQPNRPAEAIAEFEEALRLKPDYPYAHYNLGRVLATLPGREDEAVAQFQQALLQKPDYAEALYSLGAAVQMRPGRLNEAIAHYGEALRLKPDFFQAHFALGFALALIPGRQGDAVAHYQEALRLEPGSAETHFNLARILQDIPGRQDEAIAHYEEAIRLRPADAKAQSNLGNTLFSMGRKSEGIAHFEKAAQLDPDNATMHLNLGIMLLNTPGRGPEAVTELKETLRLQPDNAQAAQILAQIRPHPQ